MLSILMLAAVDQVPPSRPPAIWNVNWGEQYCSVIHHPRSDTDLTVVLRVLPRSVNIDVLFTRASWTADHRGPDELRVSVNGSAAETSGPLRTLRYTRPDQAPLLGTRILRQDVDRALSGSRLSLTARNRPVAIIDPPASDRVRTALKDCEDAKVRAWGFDPNLPPAFPINLGNVFDSGDYPAQALREARQGTLRFLLVARADGTAAECRVLTSSGHADLDQATCTSAQRGSRFERFEGPFRITVQTMSWSMSIGQTIMFVP